MAKIDKEEKEVLLHKSLRKEEKKTPWFWIMLVAFAFAVLGSFNALETRTTYFDEVRATHFIKDEEDLIKNLSSLYNDRIILTADITISEEITIGSKEVPFEGSFEGNGFKITMTNNPTPLFGYIGREGKVSSLNVDYSCSVSVNDCFAPIAIENKGTIENCHISTSLTIRSGYIFSSIAVYNKGTIKNCFVNSMFINNNVNNNEVIIGGLTAYNSGKILNSISVIDFKNFTKTEAEKIYSSTITNLTIGAVTGVNLTNYQNTNNLMVIRKEVFVCDINDTNIKIVYTNQSIDIDYVFGKMEFDKKYWEFTNAGLTLIRGDGK